MESKQFVVEQFYREIDKENWDAVLALFDDSIDYQRIEPRRKYLIINKAELRNFYTQIRDIKGEHALQDIKEEGSTVKVFGTFEGTSNGQPIKFNYSDKFIFNAIGKVIQRKSIIKYSNT